MFWGLIMEPGRCYTQHVKVPFHVSMAALDIANSSEEPAQVMCVFDNRNYLLCTLDKDRNQCPLDLNFAENTKVSFATNGNSHIHLTGYLTAEEDKDEDEEFEEEGALDLRDEIAELRVKKRHKKEVAEAAPPVKKAKNNQGQTTFNSLPIAEEEEDESDDSDFDVMEYLDSTAAVGSEEDDDSDDVEEEDEDGLDEDDDDEEAGEEEDDDEVSDMSEEEGEDSEPEVAAPKPKQNGFMPKRSVQKQETPMKPSKGKPEVKTPKSPERPAKVEKKTPKSETKTPKSELKKQQHKEKNVQKTPKVEEEKATKAEKKTPKASSEQKQRPKKAVLKGGVLIEDVREGTGDLAKQGKFVNLYYEGRFKNNNKVFDSSKQGKGFSFRLGQGEVIKGLDTAVVGMKVGGKRRITCPPQMAYGPKGSPPTIPPNSTLVFDVELKKVH